MPAQNSIATSQRDGLPSFRALYAMTFVVGGLLAWDLACWLAGWDTLRAPWGVNLALVAALVGGARIVYAAVSGLLEGNINADLALAVAVLAALLLGKHGVAAEVTLIAMVGESLEAWTYSRTHRELGRLFDLCPANVHVRRNDTWQDVMLDSVRVGDILQVRPGERIAVDGTVLAGQSAVDQSTLTGESVPADKSPGDAAFAGTLNQLGALEIRADRVGTATRLGQVVQLVHQARFRKARLERVADRLARLFLPMVLALAAGTWLVTNWSLLAGGAIHNLADWQWMPTLSVLVVACPCALVLATPAAMLAAVAWLARRGVVVASGAGLERLASARRLAFDKTGTLTTGQLLVESCIPAAGHSAEELVRYAALAEQASEHVIARAIVHAAQQRGLTLDRVDEFQALPGAGVWACWIDPADQSRTELLVGSPRLVEERGILLPDDLGAAVARLDDSAYTPLVVCARGQVVGVLGLQDTVRPEAADVVAELRSLGITDIAMLTGDRRAAAEHVARQVGIETVAAELRPEEKAHWLANWAGAVLEPPRAPQTAMVGDGINDAPALATADTGLALGGIGSDLAAAAGDIILLGAPLAPLPEIVRLARASVATIRQNILVFAFGVNLLGVVLTAWLMPTWSARWHDRSPVAAAVFHQIGSLLGILNALRLLWFERWQRGRWFRWGNALNAWAERCAARLRWVPRVAAWVSANRSQLAYLAGLILLLAYLTQIVVFVQPDEVAVVRRCGRFLAVLPPGPHLRLPPPWDAIVRIQPHRVRIVEVGIRRGTAGESTAGAIEWNTPHTSANLPGREDEALALTGDQSLVDIAATIQYRIRDPQAYCFHVADPERLARSLGESVLREVLASRPLLVDADPQSMSAELLTTGRRDAELRAQELLQSHLDALESGLEIVPGGVCLQDVHPPLAVVDAFRDVSSAFKEKERMRNEADALRRKMLIQTAGQVAWQMLASGTTEVDSVLWAQVRPQLAGEAASELNTAQGLAWAREYVANGEAQRFLATEAARATAPTLTDWRLVVDTLARSLAGKRKLILDPRGTGRRHLLLGFPGNLAAPLVPLAAPPSQPSSAPREPDE